jgi:hypothetical protein
MSSREWEDENKYCTDVCILPSKYATFPLKIQFFIFDENPRWSYFLSVLFILESRHLYIIFYFSVKEVMKHKS